MNTFLTNARLASIAPKSHMLHCVPAIFALSPPVHQHQKNISPVLIKRFCSNSTPEAEQKSNSTDRISNFHWRCKHTWREASINTSWCLLGCSIGDFGTMIIASTFYAPFVSSYPVAVMAIATINGLMTSIMLETGILYTRNRQNGMSLQQAASTALGMSLISMISMETAMNITDYFIVGAANVTWYSVIPSMIAGFLVPLPYNYWRLKKFGKACH